MLIHDRIHIRRFGRTSDVLRNRIISERKIVSHAIFRRLVRRTMANIRSRKIDYGTQDESGRGARPIRQRIISNVR
jgi:hypothetical protein